MRRRAGKGVSRPEKYVAHPALDAATEGFRDALNELLPGQVEFDYQNAAEDIPTCATIATSFVSDGVDLIMANATPALQPLFHHFRLLVQGGQVGGAGDVAAYGAGEILDAEGGGHLRRLRRRHAVHQLLRHRL